MANPILVAFGDNLRALRLKQGLSQEELAELAGLHRTYLGGVERGERNPTLLTLTKIADALHLPATELLNFRLQGTWENTHHYNFSEQTSTLYRNLLSKMKCYQFINKFAYSLLATEYASRFERDLINNEVFLRPFISYLKNHFNKSISVNVLDIGPGNGAHSFILEKEGFRTFGIDISDKMLNIARKTCKNTQFIKGDLLKQVNTKDFHGVLAIASIHLLTKSDAIKHLRKINEILVRNGVLLLSTTIDHNSSEGFLMKKDFKKRVIRYRKYWEEKELRETLIALNFNIYTLSMGLPDRILSNKKAHRVGQDAGSNPNHMTS